RCNNGVSLVKYLPGKEFYGRHRFAGSKGCPVRVCYLFQNPTSANQMDQAYGGHCCISDHSCGIIQPIRRYKSLPNDPTKTPFRTQWLCRSHRICTVLAYWAGVRYFRTGLVLHRMGGSSMSIDLDSLTSWDADWSQLSVVVTGIGVTGFSVADTLAELGAAVLVLDGKDTVENRQAADTLKIVGVKDVLLGDNAVAGLPEASA